MQEFCKIYTSKISSKIQWKEKEKSLENEFNMFYLRSSMIRMQMVILMVYKSLNFFYFILTENKSIWDWYYVKLVS